MRYAKSIWIYKYCEPPWKKTIKTEIPKFVSQKNWNADTSDYVVPRLAAPQAPAPPDVYDDPE